ncbi:unnamed protein product [Sphagnum troendelagicum]|uniref:Uncharacterized protein n=1 Tax=Sphagnum troendelagicum TaxID=128251 RepID=A0ABP0T8I7_9BRYO
MGKEKFLANVRPAVADVQKKEQSRFTRRTINSNKHPRGPIVREEASPERGLPQLEDLRIIITKGSDVNATSSAVSQVVQARMDAIIGGGGSKALGLGFSSRIDTVTTKGESDSAQVFKFISAEDLDSTSEQVESTIISSSNYGPHRRSRKLATMMSVDENSSLLSAATLESDEVQKVSELKATAQSRMKHTQPSHAGLFNMCLVILIAVNSRLIIENLMKVFLHNSLLPISAYKDILVLGLGYVLNPLLALMKEEGSVLMLGVAGLLSFRNRPDEHRVLSAP